MIVPNIIGAKTPITDDIVFSAQQYEDIGEYDNAFHDDKTNKFEKKVLEEIQKKVNSFPDIIDPQKKRSVILDEMLMESVKEDNSMLNKKNPAPQETKKKQPQHEEILKMQTDLNLRPQSNETETNNKTRSSNSFFSKIFGRRKNSNEQNSRSTSSKQAQEELDNYMRERRKKIDELNYLKKRGINKLSIYISHFHDNHCGLLTSLVKNVTIFDDNYFTIERIYLPPSDYVSKAKNYSSNGYSFYNDIVEKANANDVPITTLAKNKSYTFGDAKFEVIYMTSATDTYNQFLSYRTASQSTYNYWSASKYINNNSLVTMVTVDKT